MKKITLLLLPLLCWSLTHATPNADMPEAPTSLEAALIKAIEQHDYKEVAKLLDAGANPNYHLTINGPDFTIKDGSPLMLAALNNDFLTVCELLNHGADVKKTSIYEIDGQKPRLITPFNCNSNGLIQKVMIDALPGNSDKQSTLARNHFAKRSMPLNLEMDGEEEEAVRAHSHKGSYLKSAISLLAPATIVGVMTWALLTKKIAAPHFLVGK